MLQLLTNPPDEEADARHHLLADLARRASERPGRSSWLESGRRESYTVDDEPHRVRAALDRLGAFERAALILNRYAGLPEGFLRRTLPGDEREDLHELISRSSERVAVAAGRPAEAGVADLLSRLLFDAPSVDLWDEIENDVRRHWASRRRRQRLLTVAAAASVILLLGGAIFWLGELRIGGNDAGEAPSMSAAPTSVPATPTPASEVRAAFAAAPTPETEPVQIVAVPDLHLFRMIEQAGEGRSALMTYAPDSNETAPLLEAGGMPVVSPDGRWLVATRALRDEPGQSLLAAAPVAGDAEGWELRLASPRALDFSPDSLYVLNLLDADRYQVQVIDLATGRADRSWALADHDVTPGAVRAVRIAISPDGERLAVLASRFDQSSQQHSRSLTIYGSLDGSVRDVHVWESAADDDQQPSGFSIVSARRVPGEHALYSIVPDDSGNQLSLQFLDLERGTISGISLPMLYRSTAEGEQRGENEIHLIPSNTGRMLYVIQSRQRRIAVVDMQNRGLIGVFPLTAGSFGQMELESALNRVTYMEAVLSPDGARLYMANNREKNQAINGYSSQSPVWVFDTSTWEVVDHWSVGGLPRTMTMSGDGSRVFLHSVRSDGEVHLTVFDAATGEPLDVRTEIPGPEWVDIQRIATLAGLYHAQYGVRPTVGDAVPRDNPIVSVLPGLAIEAEDAVAGNDVPITVRIVHPVTGEPAIGDLDLRFDPDATLAIELTNGEGQVIFVPAAVEPGIYRGHARLDAGGVWDARVTMINPDGTIWTVDSPAAINVAGGLAATDGGSYRFLVRPGNPVNRRTITLRVWLVGAENGDRLQQDIQFLDSIVGAPTLLLNHPSGESHEVLLDPFDHASYLGWVRLAEPGEWTARMVLELASGERYTVNAGIVEINDFMAPYQRSGPKSGGAPSSSNTGSRMAYPASE